MKILLVGDYPPPHGGIAVHVQQLQRFFSDSGVDVQVLDIGKGGRAQSGVFPSRSRAVYVRRLAAFAARKYRVHLHTSGNNGKSWLLAASVSASRIMGGPAPLITLHSGLVPSFLEASGSRRALARWALRGYARIVAVSVPVRDALISCGIAPERIEVHPAFCASQVVPGHPPDRLAGVLERRSPLLAMAHHPSPVYGRPLMLRALKKMSCCYPDVGLAVFGSGTGSDEFLADARRERVEGLIEDFGELSHGEALALLQRCQLFVRPTSADGDAISVREALALGVPCVASDASPRPAGTRVFKSGDADDLVERACEALVGGPQSSPATDAGPFLISMYRELDRVGVAGPPRAAVQA